MLSRILLFVVILALPLNFSVRTLEIPSAPPLVNASCKWLSLKPEAAIFSANPFHTAFELMTDRSVLRFCFFWPRNTVYVSTHDVVKLCCNRVLSVIQLFRERLSEKVHARIPKGIVGGFEFTFLQRNLKEWHLRPWTYVCEC